MDGSSSIPAARSWHRSTPDTLPVVADLALVDTSGYQHPNGARIDWHAVKASGVAGVYVKLTEGTAVDWYGPQDARDAAAAGLHVGVYHFAHPELHSATAEAAAFNAARAGLPCDLPPCLDTETQPITQAWNDAWLAEVPDAIGYTYRSARATLSLPDSRVWIAWPNGTRGAYLGVQYGEGPVSGIQGSVDLDWFDAAIVATGVQPSKDMLRTIVVNTGLGMYLVDSDGFYVGAQQSTAPVEGIPSDAFNTWVTQRAALFNALIAKGQISGLDTVALNTGSGAAIVECDGSTVLCTGGDTLIVISANDYNAFVEHRAQNWAKILAALPAAGASGSYSSADHKHTGSQTVTITTGAPE